MNAGLTGMMQWLGEAMPTLLLVLLAAGLLACCWWDLKTRTIPNWLNLAIAPIAKAVLVLVFLMSVAGGVLTLAYLIRHKLAKREEKLEIPYGVAIAFGGLWLISERFLNQFG